MSFPSTASTIPTYTIQAACNALRSELTTLTSTYADMIIKLDELSKDLIACVAGEDFYANFMLNGEFRDEMDPAVFLVWTEGEGESDVKAEIDAQFEELRKLEMIIIKKMEEVENMEKDL